MKNNKLRPEIEAGSRVIVCIFCGNRVEVTVWSRDNKNIYFTDPTDSLKSKRLLSRSLNNTDTIDLIY